MADPTVLQRLTPVLRDVFDNEQLIATADLTARKIEGWDSLGNVRLFLEVERVFSLRFTTAEVTSLKNLGQLAELIEMKARGAMR